MRTLILVILIFCLHLEASNSTIRIFAGYNHISMGYHEFTEVTVKDGEVIGGALGYKFSDYIRAEIEGSYRHNDIHHVITQGIAGKFRIPAKGKFESFSIMTNVLFNFKAKWFLRPYVGIGYGSTAEHSDWVLALITNNVWEDLEEGKRTALSYQLIFGAQLPAYEKTYCGVEFRYLDSILDHMCCCNRSLVISYRREFGA